MKDITVLRMLKPYKSVGDPAKRHVDFIRQIQTSWIAPDIENIRERKQIDFVGQMTRPISPQKKPEPNLRPVVFPSAQVGRERVTLALWCQTLHDRMAELHRLEHQYHGKDSQHKQTLSPRKR
jgi:hypothetical protein